MKELTRKTKETDIKVAVELYGKGESNISTGIGFFDHMLDALAKHGLLDLSVSCAGDLHIDAHHSVEDVGIALGSALKDELYPAKNIERFSNAAAVMDEACVECEMDICNRAFLSFDMRAYRLPFKGKVGAFDAELVEEFFKALAFNANICVHLTLKRGSNLHHIIEATFKAFALALRRAVTLNPRVLIPSTKGVL